MKNVKVNIQEKLDNWTGVHNFVFRDAISGEITRQKMYHNLITTACKTMIAARLAGGVADTDITYGAVGTNATAPAVGDTTLGTELARVALAGISSSGNVISATTFFGASEANGTLLEFSLFGNGASATPDSGTMINHTTIAEVKTTSETLTIESSITIA